MTNQLLETVVTLRTIVGYLGEKGQHDWWPSSYFSRAAVPYLTPLFPRTQLLAQTSGATAAASRLHDDRIGIGKVFHLFRLPEDMEQALHRALADPQIGTSVAGKLTSQDQALQSLREIGGQQQNSAAGPVHAGSLDSLLSMPLWEKVAGIYAGAFSTETQSFPYISDQG